MKVLSIALTVSAMLVVSSCGYNSRTQSEPETGVWTQEPTVVAEILTCPDLNLAEERYEVAGGTYDDTTVLWVYRHNGAKMMQVELQAVGGKKEWVRFAKDTTNGNWMRFEMKGDIYRMNSHDAAKVDALSAHFYNEVGTTFVAYATCNWEQ